MAGFVAHTYTTARDGAPVQVVTFDWLCDASGVVSGNNSQAVYGVVNRAVFVPDGGGTAPTALYDATILDEHGFDVLGGNGANRSATVTEEVVPTSLNRAIAGYLTLGITNAGNAKGGLVHLYLSK